MSYKPRKSVEPNRVIRKPYVLVVDNERSLILILERHLTPRGFQVLGVRSAEAARKILNLWPVSVVVADYRMPVEDGLEFLSKAGVDYPHVGRILLTGFPKDIEEEAAARGILLIDKADIFGRLVSELRKMTGHEP